MSRTVRRLIPFVLAFLVFALGVVSDEFLPRVWPSRLLLFLGDIVIAGIVGWVVLFYENHRRRYLEARLQIIGEMNHHVRNALQVLSYGAMQQQDENTRKAMQESVTRIDWALREILPSDDSTRLPAQRSMERHAASRMKSSA